MTAATTTATDAAHGSDHRFVDDSDGADSDNDDFGDGSEATEVLTRVLEICNQGPRRCWKSLIFGGLSGLDRLPNPLKKVG